jgi:hypothetical protein
MSRGLNFKLFSLSVNFNRYIPLLKPRNPATGNKPTVASVIFSIFK